MTGKASAIITRTGMGGRGTLSPSGDGTAGTVRPSDGGATGEWGPQRKEDSEKTKVGNKKSSIVCAEKSGGGPQSAQFGGP